MDPTTELKQVKSLLVFWGNAHINCHSGYHIVSGSEYCSYIMCKGASAYGEKAKNRYAKQSVEVERVWAVLQKIHNSSTSMCTGQINPRKHLYWSLTSAESRVSLHECLENMTEYVLVEQFTSQWIILLDVLRFCHHDITFLWCGCRCNGD